MKTLEEESCRLHRIFLTPKIRQELNILRRNPNLGPEYRVLPHLCRRDSLAIDVGGNRAWFAYYMARLSREVHVFEPNPICLAEIARVKTTNMIVHPVALSDASGRATMRFDPDNTGIWTIEASNALSNNPGIHGVAEIDVAITPLDSFSLKGVACIQIDVEGHEPAVLRGVKALLAAERPVLLVELEHRHNSATFDAVEAILGPLDYRMLACTREGLKPTDRTQFAELQAGRPDINPDYVNNFVFVPPGRNDL